MGTVRRRMIGDVPEEIVRAAMAEHGLRGRVIMSSKRREPLVCDGAVVGFVTPHETASGWRHGPIYILPDYRGRGVLQAYYASHPERTCVAFIATGNWASMKAHKEAGFAIWKRSKRGCFMRREASK